MAVTAAGDSASRGPGGGKMFELGPMERLHIREALFEDVARFEAEAREIPPRLPRRRLLQIKADAVRRLAERFLE